MTNPAAIDIPWDALERVAQALGVPYGLRLEMSPPLGFDDPQPWRLGGQAVERLRLGWATAIPIVALLRQDTPALAVLHPSLSALLDALPPPPRDAARKVDVLLAPGHALLRTEDRGGQRLRLVRPRPGAIRLPSRHSVHHFRPDARKAFAAWAARAPDGVDIETATGPAHARLAAETAIPPSLRDLPALWPEETRPRLALRTWPGMAALLLVFDHDARWRQEHILFLARRPDR